MIFLAKAAPEKSHSETETEPDESSGTPEEKEAPKKSEKLTLEEVMVRERKKLIATYGKAGFKQMIIDEIKDQVSPEQAQSIADSAWENRGEKVFEREMAAFDKTMIEIERKHNRARLGVRKRAIRQWRRLKATSGSTLESTAQAVREHAEKRAQQVHESNQAESDLIELIDEKAASAELSESMTTFHNYIDELGGRYFDSSWLPEDKKVRYRRLARAFQDRKREIIDGKLSHLYANGKPEQKELQDLYLKINNDYAEYSNMDGDPTTISLEDFNSVEERVKEYTKKSAAEIIDDVEMSEEEALALLEKTFDNKKVWGQTVDILYSYVMDQAVKDGNQNEVMAIAEEIRDKTPGDAKVKINNYNDAYNYLYKKVKEASQAENAKPGAKDTIDLIGGMSTRLNKRINEEVLQGADEETLKIYRKLIEPERDPKNPLMPEAKRDRVMVLFVRGYPEYKKKVLRSPGLRKQLFRAIRTAETKYKPLYEGNASLSAEQVATLKALELIAKEARIMVENFDTHEDMQHRNFTEDLKKTRVAAGRVHASKLVTKKFSRRFRSALSRGGFNARDFGLVAIQAGAGVTILVDAIGNISSSEEEGIVNKTIDALTNTATNPIILISIAAAYGANILQDNPQYFNHLKYGEYGKKRNHVVRTLNDMVDKLGFASVRNFIHDRNEWKAMLELVPDKLGKLVDKAKEDEPSIPLITRKDLENEGVSDYVITMMEDDDRRREGRFKFYQALLDLDIEDQQDITELKEMTTGNSVI